MAEKSKEHDWQHQKETGEHLCPCGSTRWAELRTPESRRDDLKFVYSLVPGATELHCPRK